MLCPIVLYRGSRTATNKGYCGGPSADDGRKGDDLLTILVPVGKCYNCRFDQHGHFPLCNLCYSRKAIKFVAKRFQDFNSGVKVLKFIDF